MKEAIKHLDYDKIVDDLVAKYPDKATLIEKNSNLIDWFVRQALIENGSKVNPFAISFILRNKLL